jgi:hypothetical protein
MPLTITRPPRRIEILSRAGSTGPAKRETFRGAQTSRAVKVELHKVRQSGRIACAVIDGTVVLDGQLEGWLR